MSDEKPRHGNRGELLGIGKIGRYKFNVEDISSSGCRIRYMGELTVGETYDLTLEIYGHPGMKRHIELKAKLIRFISTSELVGNEYALEFIGLSEMARIDLDELINLTHAREMNHCEHKFSVQHNIDKET